MGPMGLTEDRKRAGIHDAGPGLVEEKGIEPSTFALRTRLSYY